MEIPHSSKYRTGNRNGLAKTPVAHRQKEHPVSGGTSPVSGGTSPVSGGASIIGTLFGIIGVLLVLFLLWLLFRLPAWAVIGLLLWGGLSAAGSKPP